MRRRYRMARPCQDCGRQYRPVTRIVWWSSGFVYFVCSDCIKPYRGLVLPPRGDWARP